MECDDRMSTWNEIQTKIAIISHWFCGYTFYIFLYMPCKNTLLGLYVRLCLMRARLRYIRIASRFLDLFIFFTILSVGCFFFIFVIVMWFALAREISDALTIYISLLWWWRRRRSVGRSHEEQNAKETSSKNRQRVKNKKKANSGRTTATKSVSNIPYRRTMGIRENWFFDDAAAALTTGMYQGVFTQGLRAIHITWSTHRISSSSIYALHCTLTVHKNVYTCFAMCAVEMQIWNPRELFNKTAKIYERCSTGCPALMSLR